MRFYALLTLIILLLVNFMQNPILNEERYNKIPIRNKNVRKDENKKNSHLIQSDENSKNTVLGSYVISYDAVSSYASENNVSETNEVNHEPQKIQEIPPTPIDQTPEIKEELVIEILDNATILMNKINTYRGENGLPSFTFDGTVCNFAHERSQELANDFSHDGFRGRIDNGTLPYSDYSHIAENIADTDTPERAFELWRNSQGHNENMLNGSNYGCVGNSGRFYTLEVWIPLL